MISPVFYGIYPRLNSTSVNLQQVRLKFLNHLMSYFDVSFS